MFILDVGFESVKIMVICLRSGSMIDAQTSETCNTTFDVIELDILVKNVEYELEIYFH